MRRRCLEFGIHNASIQCNLFSALVASVLNSGCATWGVYHLDNIDRQHWGVDCQAEMMHRMCLRMMFGLPGSSTGMVMMHEARRVPLVHGWCKQIIGWWNRIMKRPDTDLSKQGLRMNMTLFDTGAYACWTKSFITMLSKVDPS